MRIVLLLLILGTLDQGMAGHGRVGGYSPVASIENDAEVQEAAKFAAEQMGVKLERIISAQTQVVAGLNFKLQLQTSSGVYDAVVYKGLGDAPLNLTSHHKA